MGFRVLSCSLWFLIYKKEGSVLRNKKVFLVLLILGVLVLLLISSHRSDNVNYIDREEKPQEIINELSEETASTIYIDSEVHVFQVDMLDEYSFIYSDWLYLTEQNVFDESDAILEGNVSNIEEIAIEYISNNILKTEYRTRFDFEITEILYDEGNTLKVGEVVKISVPFSTRANDESMTTINNLNEFIIFCESAVKFDAGPVKMSDFIDYGITSPHIGIIPKNGNYYEISDFFATEYPYKDSISDKIGYTYRIDVDTFKNIIKNKVTYYLN